MTENKIKVSCGLVMPISDMGTATVTHWRDVKSIVEKAIQSIGEYDVTVKLVSEEEHVDVIQKNIIQNLYESDIVICDVSHTNGNVMFELGMRLAFDKPTIIIKDDETNYLFDTGVIEHLEYPRDLRFNSILEFQEKLKNKVKATYENRDSISFLSNFGTFRVAKIDSKTVPIEEYNQEIMEDIQIQMKIIRRELSLMRSQDRPKQSDIPRKIKYMLERELYTTARHYVKSYNLDNLTELQGNEDFYRFAMKAHMETLDKIFSHTQQKYDFIVESIDQIIKKHQPESLY